MSLLPRPTSSSIVELILELFCETAKRILCYFTPSESRALYEASLALVRTYAAHQVKRARFKGKNHKLCPQAGRKVVDKEAEEEQYRDLTLLMELLTNLLSKDFIDLSPADSGETVEEVIATNQDNILDGSNVLHTTIRL